MAQVLLNAFNGQLNLRQAYNYDRTQVYNFLQDVVNNPATYGITDNQRIASLTNIRNQILELSLPNGARFRDNNLRPDQHIYRSLDPNRAPPNVSIFRVERHVHYNKGYWSPYDLLGLFLSDIEDAPLAATKGNFYLPITAVYGRWCRQIAGRVPGRNPNGVGDLPYMFQCTWRVRPGNRPIFFLGASLAGYNWDYVNVVGNWETVLKRARFDLLWFFDNTLSNDNWNFNNSPMIVRNGPGGTRFGNCAETYPFMDQLMNSLRPDRCYGLALQRPYFNAGNNYQDRASGDVWTNLRRPCGNCSRIISRSHGRINNFHQNLDIGLAPP